LTEEEDIAERYEGPGTGSRIPALDYAACMGDKLREAESSRAPEFKAKYRKWLDAARTRRPLIAESLLTLADDHGVYLSDFDYPNIGHNARGETVVFDYDLAYREKRKGRFFP